MIAQHFQCRWMLDLRPLRGRVFKVPAFRQVAADIDTDAEYQDTGQERQAPAPAHEVFMGQHLHQVEGRSRQYETARNPQLTPGSIETDTIGRRVFADHQHATTPLAT
ncbi:hypothetical protein D3C86_1770430 [compost metagenome]